MYSSADGNSIEGGMPSSGECAEPPRGYRQIQQTQTQVTRQSNSSNRKRKARNKQPPGQNRASQQTSTPPKMQAQQSTKRWIGTKPNLLWRAVPMEDLREHPNYRELPLPHEVYVTSPNEYPLFRQDSWQWDYLHAGRLTTSRVASCLGFYESVPAKIIGVPRSLTKPGSTVSAWMHVLSDEPNVIGSELNQDFQPTNQREKKPKRQKVWVKHTKQNSTMAQNFLYQYRPEREDSSEEASKYHSVSSAGSARMIWGSTQEATAILAAVNYFGQFGAAVAEIGLCPFELPYPNQQVMETHYPGISNFNLPPMGASPDGLIIWPDGAVEVLEVKNHSPFRDVYSSKPRNQPLFELNDRGPFTQTGGLAYSSASMAYALYGSTLHGSYSCLQLRNKRMLNLENTAQ
eukprot:CAMPEP_0117780680 /NCGR_PEP_ID=MMETSP0948-20121206/2370_1 /TAXON_ID=44440 /ORGANISM="Chattonella subsalsa, Strain CCMP2191" /LENGTH=402 /DNA_ID=CAMNT_0005608517 /DNA_START=183 /DNA_END=1391 /DNA_ORIENTATION=+